MKTFEFTAPSAEEYKLIEAGILPFLFIPVAKVERSELYDENDDARKFETVIIKSPSGKKHIECEHALTDVAKPGYNKAFEKGFQLTAVQHMYRVHVKLKKVADEVGQGPENPA